MSPINPGVHIVFVCERCKNERLTLRAENHCSIDSAYERARELRWTFQARGIVIDDVVVCPSCSDQASEG